MAASEDGSWLPLLLTAEARAVFLERSMFATTEPRILVPAAGSAPASGAAMATDAPSGGAAAPAPAPATSDDDDPNRRPVICCDLKMVDALALMVAPEPWGLHNWCLQNLLRETFSRLIQQNRVYAFYPAGTNDPTALVFNTGLVTPQLVALYALVVPSASRSTVVPNWMKGVPWMVTNFYDEAQLTDAANWVAIRRRCATLSQTLHAAALLATDMPKRATYVDDDLGQIFSSYDGRIPIADQHVQPERLLGNAGDSEDEQRKVRAKLPYRHRNMSAASLQSAITTGLARTRLRLSLNPRLAVPAYSRSRADPTAARIDILVPVSLGGDLEPDSALLLDRTLDPRTGTPCYLIQRVLDLKWARAVARAIMPVDQDWLDAGIPGGVHATVFEPRNGPADSWGVPENAPFMGRGGLGRGGMPFIGRSGISDDFHGFAPGPAAADNPASARVEVPVPAQYIPMIIGRGGAVIQRISQETRTTITSPRRGESGNFVITGFNLNDAERARALILSSLPPGALDGPNANGVADPYAAAAGAAVVGQYGAPGGGMW